MKLRYAKLWLKKYIYYNYGHLDENKLNRAIINLSHRVYKSHGIKGHNVRQKIREILTEYSKEELAKYNVQLEHPIQIHYIHRFRKPTYRISYSRTRIRRLTHFIITLIKVVGILLLLLIILYVLTNF